MLEPMTPVPIQPIRVLPGSIFGAAIIRSGPSHLASCRLGVVSYRACQNSTESSCPACQAHSSVDLCDFNLASGWQNLASEGSAAGRCQSMSAANHTPRLLRGSISNQRRQVTRLELSSGIFPATFHNAEVVTDPSSRGDDMPVREGACYNEYSRFISHVTTAGSVSSACWVRIEVGVRNPHRSLCGLRTFDTQNKALDRAHRLRNVCPSLSPT